MKKNSFFTLLILLTNLCFAQVGVGTTAPDASSILDVNSTTKGLLPPRVTKAQRDAILNPATGLVVYCTNCSSTGTGCLTTNNGTSSTPLWECLGVSAPSIAAVCNGFVSGTYIAGFSVNGSYTVTITNSSFSTATIAFQSSDLVLSGVSGSPALTVGTPTGSPALSSGTATLVPGASVTVTYPITGTPTASGTLTGSWTKLTLNCSATKAVTGLSSSLATTYCTNATVNGTFVSAIALNSTNTFKVTLTNTSGSAISSLPAPATSNLALSYSGTTSTGFTVNSVTPAATFNLAAGASQEFVYTISGTASSTGTLTLNWTYSDLTCTKTRAVSLGDAVFTKAKNNAYVFSVNDASIPINSQGTLAIGTTIQVPYTSGSGSYLAFASSFVSIPSQYCEDGASDWTFGYSYSAGTFASSGNITVTLITRKAGVSTAWTAKRVASVTTINFDCVTLPWSVNGNAYSNTVGLDEGGDAIRGAIAVGGNTSGSAYDAANVNDIVPITEAEYNAVSTIVPGSVTVGMQVWDPNATYGAAHQSYTVDGSTATAVWKNLPVNAYITSFRTAVAPTTLNYLRIGCGSTTTATTIALSNLSGPFTSGSPLNSAFYAVKRPSTNCGTSTLINATSNSSFYIFDNSTFSAGAAIGADNVNFVSSGGTFPTLSVINGVNYKPYLQVKASTQKSW